jgi:hypothetical protein
VQSNQIKKVIQQVSNPASAANPVEREKLVKLKDTLTKASKDGNQLASSLLSVSTVTPTAEIERLQEKIMEEKGKGVSFATEIADIAKGTGAASLPAMNRVQTVTQQDFQAVKDMWKENYHNLEVPEGMAGTRTAWIKDDIAKIDNIIGMLTSTDAEKVNEGMQEVSNILPFLLMGGFSQTEIISYLKAKGDAAKEVSVELTAEEETTVSVETKHATAERTMAATMDEGTSGGDDSEDESALANLSTATKVVAPQVSNEILTMVNLKVPKMRDIARYETMSLSKDSSKLAEVQKMHEVLERIANPTTITLQTDREHYEKLKEKLVEESKKGNMTATMILSAALKAPGKTSSVEVKNTLAQIANPASVVSETDKKRFTELHEKLNQASQQGNELAKSILAVKEDTSGEDIEKLSEKLRDAKQKGEDIATSVLSKVDESATLPQTNSVQAVAHEEYEEVKKMWEENYRKLPVPAGFHDDTVGRIEWITSDGVQIQQTIDLLLASEPDKKAEGIKKVSAVLPFLLLGGFSQQEMAEYLRTKLDAGKTVLGELKTDEGTQEKVAVATHQQEATKTMAAETEQKEEEKK